jgi:phosphoribosylformylglycinamidine synthase
MEGITLPVWVAHGEGQFVANNDNIAIQYVDNTDSITEKYPYNPNGSENGVAGMCSIDGRHLAMMPHPERSVLGWQLPYHNNNQYTFWLQMFINAYKWCDTNI